MAPVKCILGVAVLLSVSAWSVSEDVGGRLDTAKASVTEKPQDVKPHLDLDLDQDPEPDPDPDLDQDPDPEPDPDQDPDQDPEPDPDQDPDPVLGNSSAHFDPDVAEDEEDADVSSERDSVSAEEEDNDSAEEEDEEKEDEEDSLSVSERLELANKDLEGDEHSEIEDGDVMVQKSHVQKRNADRCVRKGCKWPRSRNRKVYVPYVIANHYSRSQLNTIHQALRSFDRKTCIRFIPRHRRCDRTCRGPRHRDYLYIHSGKGCSSYIGRRGRKQRLSLKKNGCVYKGVIQHELLHALGFHHEHKRSDRDSYVRVLSQNIIPSKKHNFIKKRTLNLGTPYDYNSVMHYGEKSFSKNGKPTLVARRSGVTFGKAKEMSSNDIARVNRLYCR